MRVTGRVAILAALAIAACAHERAVQQPSITTTTVDEGLIGHPAGGGTEIETRITGQTCSEGEHDQGCVTTSVQNPQFPPPPPPRLQAR
jgi:hypothetical protein